MIPTPILRRTKGSTIVSLKADYVRTLSAGEYTLGIVSTNGTATTTFTVHAPAPAENAQTTSTQPASTPAPTVNRNNLNSPPTMDESPVGLWVVASLVSGGLLVVLGVVVVKKKRSTKEE